MSRIINFERTINFEEGWDIIQKGIKKLKNNLEGFPETQFTTDDYSMLYTTIYCMCSQMPPHDYSMVLYDNYKEVFEEYIRSTVLPSLREKKDEFLLRELLQRWSIHKTMTRCLSRCFHYLHRCFIIRNGLTSLEDTAFLSFYNLVYGEMHNQVMQAIIAMIDRKRAGEPIDETLINNALTFYSEIGDRTGKTDPIHLAEILTKENALIYSMSRLQIA